MVIFFFSGACAPAASASVTATSAAAARMKGFIGFPPDVVSEADAELRGERGVAAHALGFEGEVHADQVEVRADEPAAPVGRGVGKEAILDRSMGMDDATPGVRREKGETLGDHRVERGGPELQVP